MGTPTVVVKVGQIWGNNHNLTYKVRITSVVGNIVYAQDLRTSDGPERFGSVKSNGMPDHSWTQWSLINETSSITTIANRECPCGIFRGDCDYHK